MNIDVPLKSVGFPPIARADARILILGSLPGEMSLQKQEYYGNPKNAFWDIMGEIIGAGKGLPYEDRQAGLMERQIALWDVCAAGARKGSLDSDIKDESVEANDFASFFRKHTSIQRICFNGGKSEALYKRKVLPYLPREAQALPRMKLPSTSPAHAGKSFEQKLLEWQVGVTGRQ